MVPERRRRLLRQDFRVVEGQARRFVDLQGAAPVKDPLGALEQLAGEALALKSTLGSAVEHLEELRYRGRLSEQVRGELTALLGAMAQAERLLVALAKLDLDEDVSGLTKPEPCSWSA